MTASMILWTLELLDWARVQLVESWPKAKLRGGAPDIAPEPYRIRFREDGKQYWLVLSPDTIRNTGVSEVASLLESTDWIQTIKKTGGISVDVNEPTGTQPVLIPWPALGPEVKVEASA
jgi:hypothetical protein